MKFFDFFRKKQGAEPVITDGGEISRPITKNPYSSEEQNYFDATIDEDDFGKDPLCDDDPDFPETDDINDLDEFDFF